MAVPSDSGVLERRIKALEEEVSSLKVEIENLKPRSLENPTEHLQDMQASQDDELLPDAISIVLETWQASASMLQRRLKLSYSRAARLLDQMERKGYIGPYEGPSPRKIFLTKTEWNKIKPLPPKTESSYKK